MTTNPYFSYAVKSEQNLYEDLVIESLKIYGQDVYYLPRTIVNLNTILGDDIPSKFSAAYKIEMYIENVDGFAGEGHIFQKFGIELRDQATFIVSRRRWKESVSSFENSLEGDLPENGDLIYLPLTKSLFQIMHVERESPFYQLSNLNVVRLECELFEYNDEDLDTGIPEIDAIETLGYEFKLTLDSDSAGNVFNIGDIFTQTLSDGTTIQGEVTEWDEARQKLSLAHVSTSDGEYHVFTVGGTIVSSYDSSTRIIRGTGEDYGDQYSQNDVFDSAVDPFLSFDESNPFGSPE